MFFLASATVGNTQSTSQGQEPVCSYQEAIHGQADHVVMPLEIFKPPSIPVYRGMYQEANTWIARQIEGGDERTKVELILAWIAACKADAV